MLIIRAGTIAFNETQGFPLPAKSMFITLKIVNKTTPGINILNTNGKYQEWHTVYGLDDFGSKCVKIKIQPYLRIR